MTSHVPLSELKRLIVGMPAEYDEEPRDSQVVKKLQNQLVGHLLPNHRDRDIAD